MPTAPDWAIIGSSIGVINACGYATGGVSQLETAWRNFSSLSRIFSPSLRHNPLVGLSLFSMDRLSVAVEEHVDFPKVFESRLDLEFVLPGFHAPYHTVFVRIAESDDIVMPGTWFGDGPPHTGMAVRAHFDDIPQDQGERVTLLGWEPAQTSTGG